MNSVEDTQTEKWSVETEKPGDTRALGECLGQMVRSGDCLALSGQLGAGKTCFVCGLAQGMEVEGRVASPSFIIMRTHPGPIYLFHADAYRIDDPRQLEEAGLHDWLEQGVVAIEWADRITAALPADALQIRFEYTEAGRRLTFVAGTDRHARMLKELRECAC